MYLSLEAKFLEHLGVIPFTSWVVQGTEGLDYNIALRATYLKLIFSAGVLVKRKVERYIETRDGGRREEGAKRRRDRVGRENLLEVQHPNMLLKWYIKTLLSEFGASGKLVVHKSCSIRPL